MVLVEARLVLVGGTLIVRGMSFVLIGRGLVRIRRGLVRIRRGLVRIRIGPRGIDPATRGQTAPSIKIRHAYAHLNKLKPRNCHRVRMAAGHTSNRGMRIQYRRPNENLIHIPSV